VGPSGRGLPRREIPLTPTGAAGIVAWLAISSIRDERRPRRIQPAAVPAGRGRGRDAGTLTRSPPETEVQAVRILVAVTFAASCLSLAGCQSSRQGRGGTAQAASSGRGQTPFLGTPVGPSGTASAPASEGGSLASSGPSSK